MTSVAEVAPRHHPQNLRCFDACSTARYTAPAVSTATLAANAKGIHGCSRARSRVPIPASTSVTA